MYLLRLRQVLIAVGLVGALAFLAEEQLQAQQAGTIRVVFTNRTDQRVTFFLNGGQGLETRLDPGESQAYTMVVDGGVQPTVKIYQPSGGTRTFTVANGGQYAFRLKDGEIYNYFD
jgi:hypothetical protein